MPAAKKQNAASTSMNEDALYTPPLYNPTAGKKAFDAIADDINAVQAAERVTTKIDVEAATYAALGVVGFVTSKDVRPRFARLPKEEFNQADVDQLQTTCFAMLYVLVEARAAGALEDEVRIPAALVAEASEVETRMQALCEYQFADDPEIAPELARLRPGTGHRDLANDLIGYARVYELRADAVKADSKHYRADDVSRAEALSGAMIQQLAAGMTPKARAAYDRYARTWALLNKRYNEVRAAGLWLYRGDVRLLERFPSLFAASRSIGTKAKRAASKEAGERAPEDGGAEVSDAAAPA